MYNRYRDPGTLRSSFLVQRLQQVRHVEEPTVQMKVENNEITLAGMEARQKICSYDYMGSAEFEFGAIPSTLKDLIKDAKDLVTFTAVFDVGDGVYGRQPPEFTKKDVTFYCICRKIEEAAVSIRVRELVSGAYEMKGGNLKEALHLKYALGDKDSYLKKTQGWLELDNGFYFFLDETMWKYTYKLFTGKLPEVQNG